jgi:hypothetical protein
MCKEGTLFCRAPFTFVSKRNEEKIVNYVAGVISFTVFTSVADIYPVVGFAAGFPTVAGVPTVVDAPAVADILLFLTFLLSMMASLLLLTCTVATWLTEL